MAGIPLASETTLPTTVTAFSVSGGTVTISQPAQVTQTAATLEVFGLYPIGTLAVTVTPSTGVTIADYNFDASNPPDPDHNTGGAAICNFSAQAAGQAYVLFGSAGTFTVSAAYVSADGLYPNASAPSLSVTAT